MTLQTVESFYVGGEYVEMTDGTRMANQVYVQCRTPASVTRPYPVVMIHGGGQTGANFETTPDGRPGWADHLVADGFTVYLVDQPARGRSAYIPEVHGEVRAPFSTVVTEQRLTATGKYDLWPQAGLHTQWPGSGEAGDPVFDHFYASQVQQMASAKLGETVMRAVGAALLDRIGAAILLTHSQSGSFGWQIGDARPDLVKAILAIEPGGPPFVEVEQVGPPEYLHEGKLGRPYGITVEPVAYDPPVTDPTTDLEFERFESADPHAICPSYLQREPARRLVNLSRIPVLLVTGEASRHVTFDRATVEYLRQATVDVTHLELAEHGVLGNGHLMMLEKNNLEIAGMLVEWLEARGLTGSRAADSQRLLSEGADEHGAAPRAF